MNSRFFSGAERVGNRGEELLFRVQRPPSTKERSDVSASLSLSLSLSFPRTLVKIDTIFRPAQRWLITVCLSNTDHPFSPNTARRTSSPHLARARARTKTKYRDINNLSRGGRRETKERETRRRRATMLTQPCARCIKYEIQYKLSSDINLKRPVPRPYFPPSFPCSRSE